MASLSIAYIRRLTGAGVSAPPGCCLNCRGDIKYMEEWNDYRLERRSGIGCSKLCVMLAENGIESDLREARAGDTRTAYSIRNFRLRMLAWQWQTGRTLAGYWRR